MYVPITSSDSWDFNPRAPYGARLYSKLQVLILITDFNPRAPYGARRHRRNRESRDNRISILAPHTGRDPSRQKRRRCPSRQFQSSRPIRGATGHIPPGLHQLPGFQSSRPIRGATCCCRHRSAPGKHFNPRAPYGARLERRRVYGILHSISILAPHTGRDVKLERLQTRSEIFQSSRPIRGATLAADATFHVIHNFNPRAPYGARPPPLSDLEPLPEISILAPHTGRDLRIAHKPFTVCGFQSSRPIRGATAD